MRVFLTGGTGFIGGHIARKLRERGDDVAALARSPDRAGELTRLGCEVVEGDLSDGAVLARGMSGCDAAIHGAAIYKVGIPKSERPAMWEANVRGTERMLDAAVEAGVPRIVYVSTVNIFGNTHGQAVDETYERSEADGFLSCYDETKYRSHQVARDRLARGAPIVVVQPGGVYGPGDHSEVGKMIEDMRKGKLRAKVFPEGGGTWVYVEDVADGVLLALDKGEIGESYVLGGERARLGEIVDKVAAITGRKPPRVTLPPVLMKLSAPLGPVIGPALGFPPNLREAIKVIDGVTYWARDDKAREQLGYRGRDLDQGLRDTLAASG
ncbi:MAG: NAD-dependent epimerase/dehydratase family protein [Thermoleophilaceae bacterium]